MEANNGCVRKDLWYLKVVKHLLFLIFSILFAIQMSDVISKFVDKKTFWTSEEKRVHNLGFPGFTICSRQKFKNTSFSWITREDFYSIVFKPEDFFHPETIAQFNNESFDLDLKESLSLYFGLCYTVSR